jgi:hypothetical protein
MTVFRPGTDGEGERAAERQPDDGLRAGPVAASSSYRAVRWSDDVQRSTEQWQREERWRLRVDGGGQKNNGVSEGKGRRGKEKKVVGFQTGRRFIGYPHHQQTLLQNSSIETGWGGGLLTLAMGIL